MATETPQQKRIKAQEAKKSYGRRRTELIRTLTADLKAAKDKIERYERLLAKSEEIDFPTGRICADVGKPSQWGLVLFEEADRGERRVHKFDTVLDAFESLAADDVRDTEAGRR